METHPLIVQCCHCRWCQRESGSAFALNAPIEDSRITCLGAEPELVKVPSESGEGQVIARCPNCRVAVWSNYDGPELRYVRVGTLDQPDLCPPDIHIFTESKQPWVVLPEGTPTWGQDYEKEDVWSKESMERMKGQMRKEKTENGEKN
ncbi:hypothetical protein MMC12_007643 [Toensbergia leucococca]|nr:hypothetical protein [Toensbergia leucococca]